MEARVLSTFRRFDAAELRLCRCLNRSSQVLPVCALFRAVSRLGDGWFWYGWIAALPLLYPETGLSVAAQMALTGAVGVILYKLIKNRAVRERPFITHHSISCAAAPLDRYSFPSGHTLHAVSFTLIMTSHYPEWGAVVGVFAILVALSRVVLGLHYPTDVAAGAIIGLALASTSMALMP
jgi:undecaprenyl-diphosphatase